MAAKKRPSKSAPTRLRRSSARLKAPQAVKAAPAPAPVVAPEAEPVQTMHYGPIIIAVVVVLGLGWWALKPKSTDTAANPAPAVPAAAPASNPTTVPAPAAAQPAPVAEAKPAHRQDHGDETTLTFKAGKAWSVRCWRSADSPASLDIFGRRNVRVRSIVSDPGAPGWQTLSWDGLDDKGALVPKGRYYAVPSQKNEQLVLELRVKN